jgi:hypothetical protein
MSAPDFASLDALAERRAWQRGELGYLLSRRQRRAVAKIRRTGARRFVLVWTRRGGKSRVKCTFAIEECLRNPGHIVKYAAPTQDMAREIVVPLMTELLDGAEAAGIQVKFNVQQMRWTFPNGSTIRLAGCDGRNANRLRGTAAHLVIVDEAGFVEDNLEYVITSVLRPQIITTQGRMILSSTPPKTPSHAFEGYAAAAKARGDIDECTIDEVCAEPDSHIKPSERDEAIADAGGRDSTACKREYFCRFETDEKSAIIPEWGAHADKICIHVDPPAHRTRYVAADFGFSDLTFVVFAWVDWERARVVVEDELVFEAAGAVTVGEAIVRKERELWGRDLPALRVADASNQLLATLHEMGVEFAPVVKTDADAALTMLRTYVQRHRVIVDPRCKALIAHCAHGIWNGQRTSFARIGEGLGHFDGIDALKYLVRHADVRSNPTPDAPPPGVHRTDWVALPKRPTDFASSWRKPRRH